MAPGLKLAPSFIRLKRLRLSPNCPACSTEPTAPVSSTPDYPRLYGVGYVQKIISKTLKKKMKFLFKRARLRLWILSTP
jgi:hypothetical protein